MANQFQILVQTFFPKLRGKTWASRKHAQAAFGLRAPDAPPRLPALQNTPTTLELKTPPGILKAIWRVTSALRNFGK